MYISHYHKMQYHLDIDQSTIDIFGNCVNETRYQIMQNGKKHYIHGYDVVTKKERNLALYHSSDMKTYTKLFDYQNDNSHTDLKSYSECDDIIFNTITKIYNIKCVKI